MFLKKIKNKFILFLLTFLLIPNIVFAYSPYIIAGGENIGIELNSNGIIIVGTYEIGSNNPAKEAKLQNGDKIIKVNNILVTTIEEMLNAIEKANDKNTINLGYLRANKEYETILNLKLDNNGVLKTGLYVKDSINGVGTLTYIDPNTKLYGALGHEIIEKTTGQRLDIKNGKIYNSIVTDITKSNNGTPGEKNATYNTNIIYGNVLENTSSGIFGNYNSEIVNKKLYKVGEVSNIKTGNASILTVINNEKVESFDINIIRINNNGTNKNILFEIIDQELLDITGGIVQGMSGSPIIQDEYIIGAVTHVVVDDPTKGYGIFITSMLEEAEN